jgi:hypothetical protein
MVFLWFAIPTTDSKTQRLQRQHPRDVDGPHLGELEDLLHLFLRDVVEDPAEAWRSMAVGGCTDSIYVWPIFQA